MPITIEYQARRSEVWAIYWWVWRRRLWRSHAILVAMIVSLMILGSPPPNVRGWLILLGTALALPAFLILYPQLRFKPQTRSLTIDSNGMKTSIGSRGGSIGWRDIVVSHLGDALILQRKRGNAMIVPARAFASPEAAEAFAREAKQAAAGA